MDLTKLLALMDSQTLFFPRADKLGDPFEGSWPKQNVADRYVVPPEIEEKYAKNYRQSMQNLGKISKAWTTYAAISCWHLNQYESAAMWNLYLSSNAGIAVKTTYAKFRDSFVDDEPVYVGSVKYIDYEKDKIPGLNMLAPYAHKRMSFEHEQEVRAVVLKVADFSNPVSGGKSPIEMGIPIKIDISKLVSCIYVAPSSPTWFFDLVQAVVLRFGYDFEVVQSDMINEPVY